METGPTPALPALTRAVPPPLAPDAACSRPLKERAGLCRGEPSRAAAPAVGRPRGRTASPHAAARPPEHPVRCPASWGLSLSGSRCVCTLRVIAYSECRLRVPSVIFAALCTPLYCLPLRDLTPALSSSASEHLTLWGSYGASFPSWDLLPAGCSTGSFPSLLLCLSLLLCISAYKSRRVLDS